MIFDTFLQVLSIGTKTAEAARSYLQIGNVFLVACR